VTSKFPIAKSTPAPPIFSMGALLPKIPEKQKKKKKLNKNSRIETQFASNWKPLNE